MRYLAPVLALGCIVASAARAEDHARVLADFRAFADVENIRVQSDVKHELTDISPRRLTKAPPAKPLALRGEGDFEVGGFDRVDDDYSIELHRTDSLTSPFIGTISVTARFVRGRVYVSGCKPIPQDPTPKSCFDIGAKILMSLTALYASTETFDATYARQDGKWVRKGLDVRGDPVEAGDVPASWASYASGGTDERPKEP